MSFGHTESVQTMTLEEMAAASDRDPMDVIEMVLERITDAGQRVEFLRGLTERVLALRNERSDDAAFELDAWVAGWWISLALLDDPVFVADDAQASADLAAGNLGRGATSAELRARHRRR